MMLDNLQAAATVADDAARNRVRAKENCIQSLHFLMWDRGFLVEHLPSPFAPLSTGVPGLDFTSESVTNGTVQI
jgi:hypothetical protein